MGHHPGGTNRQRRQGRHVRRGLVCRIRGCALWVGYCVLLIRHGLVARALLATVFGPLPACSLTLTVVDLWVLGREDEVAQSEPDSEDEAAAFSTVHHGWS